MSNHTIVAHRGASSYATDNTIDSYTLAAAQGAQMIELDIRRTSDGQLLVFHDSTIPIPGECEQRVERLTLDALLDIPLAKGERIPRWEDVLALAKELDVGIYIELKDTDPALTTHLVNTLREARWLDRCILLGSRPDHVFFVREIAPEAQTAFSYRNASIDPILIAQACNATGLNLAWEDYPDPCALITPAWLARVRAAGLRIMSWHEEREPVMRQLVALGIEDLCTNDPAMTRRAIEAVGATLAPRAG
ncbi:MAG: glycerophosphodiester phosphodiesterase family protein [Thermoflexales bacterium]